MGYNLYIIIADEKMYTQVHSPLISAYMVDFLDNCT